MAHNRTAIRIALASAFSALTFPVYIEHPGVRADSRPFALVSLGEETSELDAMGAPSYPVDREQQCLIELHAEGTIGSTVMDAIDAMELEVEQALAADVELGGACQLIVPDGSQVETNFEQDRIVAQRSLQYVIYWRNRFGTPDIPE